MIFARFIYKICECVLVYCIFFNSFFSLYALVNYCNNFLDFFFGDHFSFSKYLLEQENDESRRKTLRNLVMSV
jgi:hypothetical protein